MVTEMYMAYTACEAVVVGHMETETTHMAHSGCEAVVLAHVGSEVTLMA